MEIIKYQFGATMFDEDQEAFYTNLYTAKNKPPMFTAWGGTKELSKQNAEALVGMIDIVKLLTSKK